MTDNPTTHTECIRTEVHVVCVATPSALFVLDQYEQGPYHELVIHLTTAQIARIFLTAAQVDRLANLLAVYSRELPEVTDDRPTADDLRAALGEMGVRE